MQKIPNFDTFLNENILNEGAILVYGKKDVNKPEKTMRVVDVIRDFKKMLDAEQDFTVILDTEGIPEAGKEAEFDVVGLEGDKIRVKGSKGNEFLVKAGKIIEIQMGNSVVDGIAMGASYLVDGKTRAKIVDYNNGIVQIKLQTGENREYTLKEWKKENFTALDDSEAIKLRGNLNESATDAEIDRIEKEVDSANEVKASDLKTGDYFTNREMGKIAAYSKVMVANVHGEGDEIVLDAKLGKVKETLRFDKGDTETGFVLPTEKMEFGGK